MPFVVSNTLKSCHL